MLPRTATFKIALGLTAALVLGRTSAALAADAGAGQGIHWKTFDEGLRDAAKHNKYTFIDVYTDWCTYCKQMDRTTFREEPVLNKLSKDFVSIKFNAESNEAVTWNGKRMTQTELAEQWGVDGFPTLLFLNSKGEIIGNYGSYADSELMVKLLGYIASGSREKGMSFDEYLKKGKT